MTTLDASFLRTVVIMTAFKGQPMLSAQAALLMIGLRSETFLASDLPGELVNGSRHLAGAATGALIAQGLIEVCGRIKSPNPNAKGRRLDVLFIPESKRSTVKTWLTRNRFEQPAEEPRQRELAL